MKRLNPMTFRRIWPRGPHLLLLLALLLTGVGCVGLSQLLTRWEAGPGGVRFSHQRHVLTQKLACQDCHTLSGDKAAYSEPDHSVCLACHTVADEQKPDESCRLCHVEMPGPVTAGHTAQTPQPPAQARIERYRIGPISFSHGKHAAQSCTSCHAAVDSSTRAVDEHLPEMAACMECHNDRQAPAACETCHPSLPLLWTQRQQAPSWPFPHPPQWQTTHGPGARAQQESCQLCHATQGCESCHQSMSPRDHDGPGWTNAMHGRKALLDRERCAACHTQPSCERCHSVAPVSHSPGFMNPYDVAASPEGVQRHRTLAQRDTRACLTCHSFTPECSTCHSSTRP